MKLPLESTVSHLAGLRTIMLVIKGHRYVAIKVKIKITFFLSCRLNSDLIQCLVTGQMDNFSLSSFFGIRKQPREAETSA